LKLEGGKEDGGPWLWGAVEVEEKNSQKFGHHGNLFILILFDVVN
jgi:hypothetical protein